MLLRSRTQTVALASGVLGVMAVASLAQQAPQGAARANPPRSSADTVVVSGYLDVIDRSDASALRDGVLESMELKVGDEVKKGDKENKGTHIGWLHKKAAELATKKAMIVAKTTGEIEKARAQQTQAISTLARSKRLEGYGAGSVSREQIEKEQADVKFATALIKVAEEAKEVNEAEAELQAQIEAEHEIRAQIDGVITEVLKRPGERVGANEAVVRIVNIDKLRFVGYVPIEAALRLKVGDVIQVRPNVEGAELEVERLTFPAKVTYKAPEAQVVGRTEVQVHALLDNPKGEGGEHVLRSGMKADATISFGAFNNAVGATR